MKKRTYVGAVTRPVSLTPVIRVENPYNEQNTNQHGTLNQSFDTLTGEYIPNRLNYPTLLGLHVLMEDPNAANPSVEVAWGGQNTVAWEVTRNGVTTAVTSQSTGDFTLSGNLLRVRMNQSIADGNVIARATGTFVDSVGRVQTAVAEVPLVLSASTATNLTLLRDKLGETGYVGEFYRLNPLTLDTVAKLNYIGNWKKRCAVQLCDGTVPLPDAFTYMMGDELDESSYLDTPEGSAFYFWFYRTPDNRLIQCTEDTEWLDAAWLAGGTCSKEVEVDLTKIKQVRLVCRAGYIPYGQMEDYLDEDGLVRPEKLYLVPDENDDITFSEEELIGAFLWFNAAKQLLARQFTHFLKPVEGEREPITLTFLKGLSALFLYFYFTPEIAIFALSLHRNEQQACCLRFFLY